MAEKLTQAQREHKQQVNEWREFSKTLAFKRLMEYIQLQKETYQVLASGPMEVYRDVPTFDGKNDLQLDFEPEKYAYLLQRGVGCDIVKMYVEDYVNPTTSQITSK